MIERLTVPDGGPSEIVDSNLDAISRKAAAINSTVAAWLTAHGFGDRLFVTFATADFEPGLRALIRSLRAVSEVPILVLQLGEWRFEHEAAGVAALQVPALVRPGFIFPPAFPHLPITVSKLWVFALTQPRRVAFLDADCVAARSVDELFQGDGFSAVPDIFLHYGERAFNSGVFAFSPSAGLRRELFNRLPSLSIADGDQSVMNAFFKDWQPLPLGFNFLRTYALVRAQARERGLRILHYTMRRPWSFGPRSPSDYALAPLDELWTEQIDDDEYRAVARAWADDTAAINQNMEMWVAERLGVGTLRQRLRRTRRRARAWIAALAVLALAEAAMLLMLLGG